MIDTIFALGQGLLEASWWTGLAWPVIWALVKVVLVLMLVMGLVTYTTLWERRLLGWAQAWARCGSSSRAALAARSPLPPFLPSPLEWSCKSRCCSSAPPPP